MSVGQGLSVFLLWTLFTGGSPVQAVEHAAEYTAVPTKQPVARVISLAPHLTELMYAIDAGDRLVAVSEYSDFPAAANKLPRIGNAGAIDLERIIALKPDLVLAWKSGTPASHLERIRKLGIPVALFDFHRVEQIADGIARLGQLTGKTAKAAAVREDFLKQLHALEKIYANRTRVSVFYQLWAQPIMTINGDHMISDMISICGGKNIFSDLASLVPVVEPESVIQRAPQVIVGANKDAQPAWLDQWRRWPSIPAVQGNHLYVIESDLLVRQSTRVLGGLEKLCRDIDRARTQP